MFEKENFCNMVDFYEPELIQILNGKNPKELFPKHFTNQLVKRKILKLITLKKGGRKLIPTDNVKIILKKD